MKHLSLLFLGAALATVPVPSQDCDTLVNEGRAYLAETNFPAARARFEEAVTACPGQAEPRVFLAALRLLTLPTEPAASELLLRMGIPTDDLDLLDWSKLIEEITNEPPRFVPGFNGSEISAFMRTALAPALQASRADLEGLVSTNFMLLLRSDEVRVIRAMEQNISRLMMLAGSNPFLPLLVPPPSQEPPADTFMDYADLNYLRASLGLAESVIRLLGTLNLEADLSAAQPDAGQPWDLEDLLAGYPRLLELADTNDLPRARQAFQQAFESFLEAAAFAKGRPEEGTRIVMITEESQVAHATYEFLAPILLESLETPAELFAEIKIHLAPLFDGQTSLRALLPRFHRSGFVLGTLPDLTLGGIFLGMPEEFFDLLLALILRPVPVLESATLESGEQLQLTMRVAPEHGYVLESASDLRNWDAVHPFVPVDLLQAYRHSIQDVSLRFYRLVDRTDDMPSPLNDDFAGRILLQGEPVSASGYTINASREADEPEIGATPRAGRSVWYSWTSTVSGAMSVRLDSTASLNTLLRVYTGTSLSSLQEVGAGFSFAFFGATEGTTYQILIDGTPEADSGGFRITIQKP